MRTLLISLLLAGNAILIYAGGVRGVVTAAESGEPLSYATIFVHQTGTGAVTDEQGKYEINLSPGIYDLAFQYLGYETVSRRVVVAGGFEVVDVLLKSQAIVLQTVTIKAGNEDPAYTIMRKAIAKARYHTQQVDGYTAKVYIKGKGQLKDYPWLAKKALEKEGITKDRLFVQESVSDIVYTRPNKFEEKVVAVFSNGKDNNTSPNSYVFGSFYQPEIAESISPLSPKAFAYYRFEYQGSFRDRDYEISKIRVTPRSRGDNVFEGTLFIVEDWWSIHSLDFEITKLGIKFQVKQIYNPIAQTENESAIAWMPVSQQFNVDATVFGFEFEYNYLATVRDYKITLNPELPVEMTVIDEKIQKEEAREVKSQFGKKDQDLQERLKSGKEITNKELNKLVKEYEKEERKQMEDPEVMFDTRYEVDSMAYKKDSTFWVEMRPVPLSKQELRGYVISDSLAEVERKREEGDSLKPSKNKGFQIWDLLRGDNYRLTETSNFSIQTPYGGFNTVEGFNLIYKVQLTRRWVKRDSLDLKARPQVSRLSVSPLVRYAFARETYSGFLRVDFRNANTRLTLEGGRYIQQFNHQEPIHPFVNTFTTLFLEQNLMKIYERYYTDLNYRQRFGDKLTFTSNLSVAKRYELFNNSTYKLVNRDKEAYTPNAPVNLERINSGFNPHNAVVANVGVEAVPWQKYRMRNGRKYRINNSSPLMSINYTKGIRDVFNSDVDFDQLEIGIKHGIRVGISGKLDVALTAGKFFNRKKMYFMDYQHFLGNRTPFITTDPVGSFRLLDYYLYSTADEYLTANVHYHFRKFLVTRIPFVRLTGITENLFVNYLSTPTSSNYTELGYSLDGILRIFRLEGAVSFINGEYQDYGFRIGIATSIGVNFGD
ncbi:MAG: DUF5686 and carboxypeptidase regulatory-like domain-containing protein [Cyclobacteriaceae bacterium]